MLRDQFIAKSIGFISFAICFAMLIGVWYAHYKFFRRYGLNDAFTIFLNMVLLPCCPCS